MSSTPSYSSSPSRFVRIPGGPGVRLRMDATQRALDGLTVRPLGGALAGAVDLATNVTGRNRADATEAPACESCGAKLAPAAEKCASCGFKVDNRSLFQRLQDATGRAWEDANRAHRSQPGVGPDDVVHDAALHRRLRSDDPAERLNARTSQEWRNGR